MVLKDNTGKYIRTQQIQYSDELGWINWNHARPASTLYYYKRFLQANQTLADSFDFVYAQKNTFNIGSFFVHHYYTERWKIKSGLSVDEAKHTFTAIFASVSSGFENMQGNMPMQLFADTRRSSFRNGDMMGNLISLATVLEYVNIDSLKAQLNLFSVEKTMELYKKSTSKRVNWMDMRIEKASGSEELMAVQQLLSSMQQQKDISARRLEGKIELKYE